MDKLELAYEESEALATAVELLGTPGLANQIRAKIAQPIAEFFENCKVKN